MIDFQEYTGGGSEYLLKKKKKSELASLNDEEIKKWCS